MGTTRYFVFDSHNFGIPSWTRMPLKLMSRRNGLHTTLVQQGFLPVKVSSDRKYNAAKYFKSSRTFKCGTAPKADWSKAVRLTRMYLQHAEIKSQ